MFNFHRILCVNWYVHTTTFETTLRRNKVLHFHLFFSFWNPFYTTCLPTISVLSRICLDTSVSATTSFKWQGSNVWHENLENLEDEENEFILMTRTLKRRQSGHLFCEVDLRGHSSWPEVIKELSMLLLTKQFLGKWIVISNYNQLFWPPKWQKWKV